MTSGSDEKIIGTIWVFQVKCNYNSEPENFKARYVANGYNYFEIYAPVCIKP